MKPRPLYRVASGRPGTCANVGKSFRFFESQTWASEIDLALPHRTNDMHTKATQEGVAIQVAATVHTGGRVKSRGKAVRPKAAAA